MLIREDERGVVAIGQQSHAWLSGQLARDWGNERFGPVRPYEEVCLAAEQHDVGWGSRDQHPRLNAATGLPESFREIPVVPHLELFTEGPRWLVSQSRYAALLVSMHGWRLYERRDLERTSPEDARAIRAFLAGQERFQAELWSALRTDASGAPAANDRLLQRNSMLIWVWDYLSLALCLGWVPATAKRCPTAADEADLELSRGEACFQLDPWPFDRTTVSVRCEGRRLTRRFEDEQAMRDALARAPWETLVFELRPR
jgi:Protein of unknown function (DUF3891)